MEFLLEKLIAHSFKNFPYTFDSIIQIVFHVID